MPKKAVIEKEANQIIETATDDWLSRVEHKWQAFRNFAVEQVLWEQDLSSEEVESITSTDGPGDLGIDGWHLDASDGLTLYIFQAKDSGVQASDLDKMAKGLIDVLEGTSKTKPNDELKEKAANLQGRLNQLEKVEFHLVTSKLAPKSLKAGPGEPIELKGLSISGQAVAAAYYVHDVAELAENLRVDHARLIAFEVSVPSSSAFVFEAPNHTRTATIAVPGATLAQLFSKERINLFRFNPRYYQTAANKVNREVLATLKSDEQSSFYLYNNGITALSTGIQHTTQKGNTKITAEDFQIVNGCQTIATLHQAWRDAAGQGIPDVFVQVKIIETQAQKHLANEIARKTNRQTAMKEEDYHSGDLRQQRLQDEFDKIEPRWFYEIKRGIWRTEYSKKAEKAPYTDDTGGEVRRIQMKDLAQSCLAFLGHPDEAVVAPGKVFADEEKYGKVFPDFATAYQLLVPYRLYLLAHKKTKDEKAERDWPTAYVRYPLIFCISSVVHSLNGRTNLTYFDHTDSVKLLGEFEWAQSVLDIAFERLAHWIEAKEERGAGLRTLVRNMDWLNEPASLIEDAVRTRISAYDEVAAQAAKDPAEFGLRKQFPLTIV